MRRRSRRRRRRGRKKRRRVWEVSGGWEGRAAVRRPTGRRFAEFPV